MTSNPPYPNTRLIDTPNSNTSQHMPQCSKISCIQYNFHIPHTSSKSQQLPSLTLFSALCYPFLYFSLFVKSWYLFNFTNGVAGLLFYSIYFLGVKTEKQHQTDILMESGDCNSQRNLMKRGGKQEDFHVSVLLHFLRPENMKQQAVPSSGELRDRSKIS